MPDDRQQCSHLHHSEAICCEFLLHVGVERHEVGEESHWLVLVIPLLMVVVIILMSWSPTFIVSTVPVVPIVSSFSSSLASPVSTLLVVRFLKTFISDPHTTFLFIVAFLCGIPTLDIALYVSAIRLIKLRCMYICISCSWNPFCRLSWR